MTDKVILPADSEDGFAHFTFDSESKFIRFYLWLYSAKVNNINTCKLFWAYVFAPLVLLIRAAGAVIGPIFDAVISRLPHKTAAEQDREWEIKRQAARERRAAKEAAGPSKFERVLEKVSIFFSAAYAKAAPVFKVVGIGLGALLGLAGAAALVYVAITSPLQLLIVAAGALGGLALIFLVLLAITWIDRRSVKKGQVPFFSTMKRLLISVHRHTCAKINLD